MSKLLIKNARVLGFSELPCDILIENGKIAELGNVKCEEARVIDALGLTAAPGIIDMHVHLRDPGQPHKADLYSVCEAAAAGGVTSLVAMPNTSPAVDSEEILRDILKKSETAKAKVYQTAAITKGLTGESMTPMKALVKAGAAGFSDDGRPVYNSAYMLKALKTAAELNVPVLAHSEDLYIAAKGIMHEGEVSEKLCVPGIPAAAEDVGTARDIALSESSGCPVHICHVSTKTSLAMIRDAKKRGVKVTCETAPHYFILTHKALENRDANFRMNPPLREDEDVKAVLKAISDGTVDALATDHAPHSPKEKSDFNTAPNGIVGLQTLFSASYTALVKTGIITENRLFELLSANPAKIMGIKGGKILPGEPADLVFYAQESYIFQKEMLIGSAQNSPFIGRSFWGRVHLTVMNGNVTYKN